jgi:hypothetical protein
MNRTSFPLVDSDQVVDMAKDAAYIAVGFGVLTFQRAQVRRQELTKSLQEHVSALDLDQAYESFESKLDDVVGGVSRALPEPAAGVLAGMHRSGKAARHQVASLLGVA